MSSQTLSGVIHCTFSEEQTTTVEEIYLMGKLTHTLRLQESQFKKKMGEMDFLEDS